MGKGAAAPVADTGAPQGATLAANIVLTRAIEQAHALAERHRTRPLADRTVPLSRMAPELTGRTQSPIDHRADLYAFGAALYEWTTGVPPFDESDPLQLAREQLTRIPPAPHVLRPELPVTLSRIVMRLLEKEPERRYQSASAVLHDLERLREAMAEGKDGAFAIGEIDFPSHLPGPSRTVGRERELEHLRASLDSAMRGRCEIVLISGAPGAGKTLLGNELRHMAVEHHGRFASGKFDQYTRADAGAVVEALSGLADQLLAVPGDELEACRRRILEATGAHAGVLNSVPQLKLFLGEQPPAPDVPPGESMARMCQVFLAFVKALASPASPVVLQLDDLQWADESSLRFVDGALAAHDVAGLVLVLTFRDNELAADDPLGQALARWQALPQAAPRRVCIGALDKAATSQILSAMLKVPAPSLQPLARVVCEQCGGNAFETVEAVNELRRAGLLVRQQSAWVWDAHAVRHHLAKVDVAELLEGALAQLPEAPRRLLRTLACLSHGMHPRLALVAAGFEEQDFEAQVADLTREGMLFRQEHPVALRWRHDRLQQAVREGLSEEEAGAIHLDVARRLASAGAFPAEAAEHYLAAADRVTDPGECLRAAAILHGGAARSHALARYDAAVRMLRAALAQLERASPCEEAVALGLQCETALHLALISSGRREEADRSFERLQRIQPDPKKLGDPTRDQLISVYQRSPWEGVQLAVELLGRHGIDLPLEPLHLTRPRDAKPLFGEVAAWFDAFDPAREAVRAAVDDPEVDAAAKLVGCATGIVHTNWLCCALLRQAQAMWDRHGPCAALVPSLVCAIEVAQRLGEHGAIGTWGPKLLAVCERKGWERERAILRLRITEQVTVWFAPLEQALDELAQSRRSLLLAGSLEEVSEVNECAVVATLECCLSLDAFAHELEMSVESAQRGNMVFRLKYLNGERQLLRTLRGETNALGSFDGDGFSELAFLEELSSLPGIALFFLSRRGLVACMFGDWRSVRAYTEPCERRSGFYRPALTLWVSALGTAWKLQEARAGGSDTVAAGGPPSDVQAAIGKMALRPTRPPESTPALDADVPTHLAHIDYCAQWLASRAVNAPANFHHMHLHLQAERAWAVGNLEAAASNFEEAMRVVAQVSRPWHRALITERAARFHLALGEARRGEQLIADAIRQYELWGAHGKARQLREQFPALDRPGADAHALDLMAVLRASQAISAEHSVASLQERVVQVLGGLTGATRVTLVLRDAHGGAWALQGDGARRPVEQSPHELPLSAFMYATRTLEPLVVVDALADDRFARDPYWQGMACCSLLVLPVLHKGEALAMLVLENSAARGAFNAGRLDAAKMIATQLAVSLDSVQLYDRMQTLYAAINEAPDAILVADPQTMEYVDVNEAAARNFGMTREQMLRVGMRGMVGVQHDDAPEQVRQLYQDVIAAYPQALTRLHALNVAGQPARTMETTRRAVRREGRWLIVIVSRDVTERERVNRELEEKVADLARSNRELEQFAYVTSHDLTEPLRMVASYAQLLERRYGDQLGDDGRDFTGYISEGARRMKALIDDILLYSRAGRANRRMGVHSLDRLLDIVLANLRTSIADNAATIERPNALPEVRCDATGVTMVLQNLLANALKFRGEHPPVVRVSAEQDQGVWTVCVADNGIGIEPRYFERIFTIFQRLHGRERYEGTGIGLSICKKVVESHGGRIWVESAPGAGASFYFTLPAVAAPA